VNYVRFDRAPKISWQHCLYFIFSTNYVRKLVKIIMALDDPKLVNNVADRLKKQGLFDKFRKECMADVDTKVRGERLLKRYNILIFLTENDMEKY